MRIIELDSFTTAFPVELGGEDAAKRCYMTLLGEDDARAKVGGTSYVSRAWTLAGEPLAPTRRLHAGGLAPGADTPPPPLPPRGGGPPQASRTRTVWETPSDAKP